MGAADLRAAAFRHPPTDSDTGAVVIAASLVEGSQSAGVFANCGDRSVQLAY